MSIKRPRLDDLQNNTVMRSSRRDWLAGLGTGLGAIACGAILGRDSLGQGQEPASSHRGLHHAPQAKCVIEIFCPGGLSHVDTWDYKPELERLDGTPFDPELGKQTFAGVAAASIRWPSSIP